MIVMPAWVPSSLSSSGWPWRDMGRRRLNQGTRRADIVKACTRRRLLAT